MNARHLLLSLTLLALPAPADEVDDQVKAIQAVAKEYSTATSNFLSRPETTADLAARRAETAEWRNEIVKRYQAEIEGKTPGGRKIETAVRHLNEQLRRFGEAANAFAGKFKEDFDAAVGKADELADKAIQMKGPGLFDGARKQLEKASAMVRVLAGFNGAEHEAVAVYAKKLEEASARIAAKDEAWRKSVVDRVEMPRDAYAGADKEALREAIQAAWAAAWPDDRILAVRLHSNSWERTERASWDRGAKAWSFSDTSVLPARVVVAKDDRTATIYMAYVNKDNASGSVNVGVATKKPEYVVQDILLEKVK